MKLVKTIRVSEEEYMLLKKARKALMKYGLDSLPPKLRSSASSKVFTLGGMAGLCAEALFYILSNEKLK